MTEKDFHIAAIFSVVTERSAVRDFSEIKDLISHLADKTVGTFGCVVYLKAAQEEIFRQLPWTRALRDSFPPDMEDLPDVETLIALYGARHSLEPAPDGLMAEFPDIGPSPGM